MLINIPQNISSICVHTGNILNLDDVKKKAGQTPTEEVMAGWATPLLVQEVHLMTLLAATIHLLKTSQPPTSKLVESLKIILLGYKPPDAENGPLLDIRNVNDNHPTVACDKHNELTTSVKVFVTSNKKQPLIEAINTLFGALKATCLDSLVLSIENSSSVEELHAIWSVLEQFVSSGKLLRIGISDIDVEHFVQLYNMAKIKPSIVQINLASCCVVPPALQEFTKQNDVQLLTHNDPTEILPSAVLRDIFDVRGESAMQMEWAARYQIHVKCRGVLATKGYIVTVHCNQ